MTDQPNNPPVEQVKHRHWFVCGGGEHAAFSSKSASAHCPTCGELGVPINQELAKPFTPPSPERPKEYPTGGHDLGCRCLPCMKALIADEMRKGYGEIAYDHLKELAALLDLIPANAAPSKRRSSEPSRCSTPEGADDE